MSNLTNIRETRLIEVREHYLWFSVVLSVYHRIEFNVYPEWSSASTFLYSNDRAATIKIEGSCHQYDF